MTDAGHGLWLEKTQSSCLILWKKLDAWAQTIHEWARNNGMEDSVMTVDELSSGPEVMGTGKHSLLFLTPMSATH